MSDKTQFNQMCKIVKENRDELIKLHDTTRSFELLDETDQIIQDIDSLCLDIEHYSPEDDQELVITKEELEKLRERFLKATDNSLKLRAKIVKKRWKYGIGWFSGFTSLFLAILFLYVSLHVLYPSTDSTIFLWTDSRRSYVEVAFWAFFGLMTWILYNLQHSNRIGVNPILWIQWYWSKLFQGVLIAIVVVVALKQIDFGSSITGSLIPVIMGFILGYYSDRAREYLDIIRDKILPGTKAPTVNIQPIEYKPTSPVYIAGHVDGPLGIEGTLTVDKQPPTPLTVDDNGDFGVLVAIPEGGRHLIRIEAKSPAKKIGSATIPIDIT
jgi:hypothetical protein